MLTSTSEATATSRSATAGSTLSGWIQDNNIACFHITVLKDARRIRGSSEADLFFDGLAIDQQINDPLTINQTNRAVRNEKDILQLLHNDTDSGRQTRIPFTYGITQFTGYCTAYN